MTAVPPHPGGGTAGPAIPDPETVAPLVAACPAVAGLHGGLSGEVATYLPGRRVRGVRVADSRVEIHVVGRYPFLMVDIAAQVRAAVTPVAGGLPVDVVVGDLVVPGDPDPEDPIVQDPPRAGATSKTATPEASPRGTPVPAFPPPATSSPAAPSAGESAPHPVPASAPARRLDSKESAR